MIKIYSTMVVVAVLALMGCGGGSSESGTIDNSNQGTTTPIENSEQGSDDDTASTDLTVPFVKYLTDLTDNHIVPSYAGLKTSAESMHSVSQSFCLIEEKSTNDLATVENQWQALNSAWQKIQWLQEVGPMFDFNRRLKLQFWPDTNNAVSRGLSGLLLEPNKVTVEQVSTTNVGAQGLPALETLIFTEGGLLLSGNDSSKRCEVLEAISHNVKNITADVYSEWTEGEQPFAEQMKSGTVRFRDPKDAVEELMSSWFVFIEKVKDQKLLFPMGEQAPGTPESLENSPSLQSLQSVIANIESIQAVYTAGNGYGFPQLLVEELEQDNMNTELLMAVNMSLEYVQQVQGPLATQLSDDTTRQAVTDVIDQLRALRAQLRTGFVQALDLSLGFNSTDGD